MALGTAEPAPGGPGAAASRFSAEVASAYDAAGATWAGGPARVYDRLATVLVSRSPRPLAGRVVADIGAGTGAASRAIAAAGGRPVALDRSQRMLAAGGAALSAVADATRLPLPDRRLGGAVAAFCYNHLPDPAAGFAEARRVCRPGSPVLAAVYVDDDDHPAKAAVRQAAMEAGWIPDGWYVRMQTEVVGRLATTEGMAATARAGGLDGQVDRVVVEMADLTPAHMLAWRLGMAQMAPFLATLSPKARCRLERRASDLLGSSPPALCRSIIVFAGVT